MLDDRFSLDSRPYYDRIVFRRLADVIALLTISVSAWFITAAFTHIAVIPPDGLFYLKDLPPTYWLGLAATILLIPARNLVQGRLRTFVDIVGLTMLSLYVIGLPSFAYQNPRFLDAYQHEGNALSLLFTQGWYNNSVWYLYQFPGSYAFFADLTTVAGIDPFQLMLYYPVVASAVVAFFVYVIARMFGNRYSPIIAGVVIGGFWFQLHLSPQSLELIPYLGVIFLLVKMFEDRTRWRLLTKIAVACIPVFVFSHPESSLATAAGVVGFVILEPILSPGRLRSFRANLSAVGYFLVPLIVMITAWWALVASAALKTVLGIVDAAAKAGVTGFTHGPTQPPTPAPSYAITLLLEEGMSAAIWLAGLFLLIFVRRFRQKEYFLMGLFLAAVATIPVAVFGNPDVLQRSYMFALFPLAFLSSSLLERRELLRLRGVTFFKPFVATLMVIVIGFSIEMPVARYGGDSFQYLSESSLVASNEAGSLTSHSVLVAHPDWYGIKYYGPFQGYEGAILLEQNNMAGRPGAFIKLGTYGTVVEYNLTYTHADSTADYISVADLFNSLYIMRFGSNSTFYLNSKAVFEGHVSQQFNLVYSTGTDRIYENYQFLG